MNHCKLKYACFLSDLDLSAYMYCFTFISLNFQKALLFFTTLISHVQIFYWINVSGNDWKKGIHFVQRNFLKIFLRVKWSKTGQFWEVVYYELLVLYCSADFFLEYIRKTWTNGKHFLLTENVLFLATVGLEVNKKWCMCMNNGTCFDIK